MFRAYDPQRERLVAVKLFKLDLPPERVHQLVAAFERLVDADLTHPVLASPLATGITGVSAFLAQDYVAAESLDLAVREYGAVPPADALRVAAQLGGALDFGAIADIFHGALHPRDVLLSTDETRLTGLGVARALEQVGVAAPLRRPYTAPERIAGGAWDRRADVFSLAALIHELLWGRRVSGTGTQAAEGLTEIPGGDLDTLRVVFTRALADEPAERFETALEFAEALKQAFPDVAITGPSPTLNPRTPKRRARAGPAAPVVPADEPRLPLGGPEPEPPPAPASESILEAPVAVVQPAPEPVPEPMLADEIEPPIAVEAPLVPDLIPEPLSPSLAFEPRFRAEEPHAAPAVMPPLALQSPGSAGAPADLRPDAFSVLEESRSAVWPLILALIVGIALGFAAGYGLGPRERASTKGGGRESTEGTVETPKAEEVQRPAGVRRAEDVRLPVPSPGEGKPDTTGAASKPAARPAPDPGLVLVRSAPSGARVVVDGRDRGTTPASVPDLASGPHRVRVTRDGYGAEERRVVITRARPTLSLNVKLTRERAPAPRVPAPARAPAAVAGALIVESRPPGARVFLDGKLLGMTPLSLSSVSAGDHAIYLDRGGYRRWSSTVRIAASENNRITASLEK